MQCDLVEGGVGRAVRGRASQADEVLGPEVEQAGPIRTRRPVLPEGRRMKWQWTGERKGERLCEALCLADLTHATLVLCFFID